MATTTKKRPAKPATEQPSDLDLAIPERAFIEAAEAIWDGGDADRMIEALRAIDEPNPRAIVPYLRLLVEIAPLLRRQIADGEGAGAEVERFGQAERAARRSPPGPDADPSKWATAVQELAKKYWQAFKRRAAREMATQWLAGLQWRIPKLFDVAAADAVADGPVDFDDVRARYEGIQNWENENDVQLERRSGWLVSRWQPRERRRRYRLRTSNPPQQQGQAK